MEDNGRLTIQLRDLLIEPLCTRITGDSTEWQAAPEETI
jgi:hypothetical protein